MSSIIENCDIFPDFPSTLKKLIKCFYVSDNSKLGYCVLLDNSVYGYGQNIHLNIGYSDTKSNNNNNPKYVLIKELCDQNIEEFYQGYVRKEAEFSNYMFARNDQNQIFSWGHNEWGQLGRGYKNLKTANNYLRPEKIDFFDDKNIINVSYGYQLCVALTSQSLVYIWGNFKGKLILNPTLIKINNLFIKSYLSDNSNNLFGLSFDDWLYRFRYDKSSNSFLWTNFADLNRINEMIGENSKKFRDICITSYQNRDEVICETVNKQVFVYKKSLRNVYKTPFHTLFEYLFNQQKSFKTIHIKNSSQLFTVDFIRNNEKSTEFVRTEKSLEFNNEFKKTIFRFSDNLTQTLDTGVKQYYQSNYFSLLIMHDNNVYSVGYDSDGKLGFGTGIERVSDKQKIPELCQQNIQDFYEGFQCMFARNDHNQIFGWGRYLPGKYLKPKIIEYFTDKEIIYIICDNYNCLALSVNGFVYNCLLAHDQIEKIPFQSQILQIHCSIGFSSVVDIEGNAYFWRTADVKQVNVIKPRLIVEINVAKVCHFNDEIFLILDKTGKLYKYNILSQVKQERRTMTFIDLFEVNSCFLLQSDEFVYELPGDVKLRKTAFNNFFDYCSHMSIGYKKTIHLTRDGFLYTKQIHFNEQQNQLVFENKSVFENKYERLFQVVGKLGDGSFGSVFEVRRMRSTVPKAIKIIEVKDEFDLREIAILSKLSNHYVVKYINSWIEEKTIYSQGRWKCSKLLYIQMEYCPNNLRDIINLMMKVNQEKYKIFLYFIASELMRELSECVHYLHSFNPMIIHRDLKPENILLSNAIRARYLKLCDFGLSKVHENSVNTKGAGTIAYMAPEVSNGDYYNDRSDIYSLSMIATELFLFDYSPRQIKAKRKLIENPKQVNPKIEGQYNTLINLLEICLFSDSYRQRPDSKEFLLKLKDLTIDKNIVREDQNITDFLESLKKLDKSILEYIFNIKLDPDSYKNVSIKKIFSDNNDRNMKNDLASSSIYETVFDEISELKSGSFGTVFEVKHKKTQQMFAIKQIKIISDLDEKEIEIINKFKSNQDSIKFIIKYYNIWRERISDNNSMTLFIQMELCSYNLRELIEILKGIYCEKYLTFLFYISQQLFQEMLECVNYLHSFNPPIIHRDLKPENILISNGINGRFLKLCDFGLSKVYENSINTIGPGTLNYIAPEVDSGIYNIKCDVYSLALIATEIFLFEDCVKIIRDQTNFNKYISKYLKTNLEEKFKELLSLLSECLLPEDYRKRPNCEELLHKFEDQTLERYFVLHDDHFSLFCEYLQMESFMNKKLDILLIKSIFELKTGFK